MQRQSKGWRFLVALPILVLAGRVAADPGHLTVKVDQPGVKISPMLYGLMTEEINHAYDGGLYAELIQNRSFQDSRTRPVHWSLVQEGGGAGTMALDTTQPINAALTTCLKLEISAASANQRVGVANEGFWGIPVLPNTRYRASFYARANGGFTGPLTISIESNDGANVYAKATVARLSSNWQQYTVQLTTGKAIPSTANRFVLSAAGSGTLWLNEVSLFPPTYRDHPNGLRKDLMQMMGEMKPAFLRLPGGNYLEGNTLAERFDWKKTLGNPSERPGHPCPWGYRSSDGLGLLEYLEWCEDLRMEPVLAVFAGYALNGEHVVAGPQLTPFVQDALDEIEYLTGDANTTWGARRVKDGHPASFPLHYVEIGNEDWFDRSGSYDGRYTQFFDAIKAKYPALQIIATAPVRSRKPDVMDDHYYRSARDMARDVHHYDRTDRSGPKIFVGEWASTEGSPTPTLKAALGDAAWLTGLERNSDIVVLESYAPLLVNVNPGARQWGTNLIGYDALKSFGSPSYYVQKMFGTNRGDVVLPVEVAPQQVAPSAPPPMPTGGVGVGTWSTQAEYKDIQVTQGEQVLYQHDFAAGTGDWRLGIGNWSAQEGALKQASSRTDCRATVGDPHWKDYTYRLKARKLGGLEGFLILFHVQNTDNYVWWNIGGWGNTRTALEKAADGSKREIGNVSAVTIETGRWYDIRVEVKGESIRCFLDDKLIIAATDTPGDPIDPLYATASRDQATGDVILKVVNTSGTDQQLDIALQGVKSVANTAEAQVLVGQPSDVNTVETPEKVAPKSVRIKGVGRTFGYTFPAYSVSVLRVKVR
ncbi:MAG TPA: alpha-L-arabinofuranosidase C-terminal domain-containing protein [Chthonomonadaceae bacterium]|nr:alpha-L-arabinofuranosidase C-terminal domain-containing protein [Chthonomonadaceae bacterium]